MGIELVKDPKMVFLDEPTSGLDSEMASQVIQTLVKLARKQRTIACTIHQVGISLWILFWLTCRGHFVFLPRACHAPLSRHSVS